MYPIANEGVISVYVYVVLQVIRQLQVIWTKNIIVINDVTVRPNNNESLSMSILLDIHKKSEFNHKS